MPVTLRSSLFVMIAIASMGAPALGQAPDADNWKLSLTPRGEYAFSAGLRSSGSKVSVGRAGVGVDLSGPLGDQARLLLNGDFESSFYRFKDVAAPLPTSSSATEPLSDVFTLRLRPGVAYRLDDRWTLLGGAIVEFSGESGADVGDSVTFGGYGGATYRVSDDLSLTFGVIAKSRLEDDALVVPLLGLRWRINEMFSLTTEGLGARLSAKVSDQMTVSVFGRYEIRDFRLDDEAAVPGGIVQDTRLPIGATIEWAPTPRFSLALSGGVIVAQKFTFLNQHGDELSGDRTKAAPFIGLRAELKF